MITLRINNIDNDFNLIVACALRVALRENDKFVNVAQNFISTNLDTISNKMKLILIRDIKERETDQLYAPLENKESWHKLIVLLEQSLSITSDNSNPKEQLDINNINNEFEMIVEASVRYGLGRRTYITSVIPEFIIANLDILSDEIKKIMIDDIMIQEDYGDSCDKNSWMYLLEKLKNSIKNKPNESITIT